MLIKPTSLVDHGPSRYQETALPFYLSQRQVQAIYDSRYSVYLILPYCWLQFVLYFQFLFVTLEEGCRPHNVFRLPHFTVYKLNFKIVRTARFH